MQIPNPVIGVVGELLGSHYYSHSRLNTLFMEHGAPGDPPEGNCVDKCVSWLKRANDDPDVDAFGVLGGVIENYMEFEIGEYGDGSWTKGRERLRKALARQGLSYLPGGIVATAGTAPSAQSLRDILLSGDLGAIEIEFRRAIESVEADPPAGITAASSLVEALCKVYIEDEQIAMPKKASLKPLWSVVSKHIGLDPGQVADEDIKRILSGLTSVVDGIASLRTHTGSAHGRGRKPYRLSPRHARLAINSAHSLTLFVLETWEDRRRRAA